MSLPLPEAPAPSATRHSGQADGGAADAPIPPAGGGVEPVLCVHCGRSASNGISCIGMCVADSGY